MILDDIQNFIDEYHLIRWGVGGLITAAAITLFLKTVVGKWKWQKDKTPLRSRKIQDQLGIKKTTE